PPRSHNRAGRRHRHRLPDRSDGGGCSTARAHRSPLLMRIGDREIGPGSPPYIIAEIGVNHDGSIARALELVDAAAVAGADVVKFQYFETDRLLSRQAQLAAYQAAAGETDPVAMLRRLELPLEDLERAVE